MPKTGKRLMIKARVIEYKTERLIERFGDFGQPVFVVLPFEVGRGIVFYFFRNEGFGTFSPDDLLKPQHTSLAIQTI